MGGDTRNTENTWTDPDDAPELNHEFFERADEYDGHRLVTSRRSQLGQSPNNTRQPNSNPSKK